MNLISFAKAVVTNPAFISKDITGDGKAETFCNWGMRLFAEALFGYSGFNDLSANNIHAKVKADGWKQVDGATAAKLAEKTMVISAQTNPTGSGHVALILPLPLVASGKWGKSVPQCANVGRTNGIMGVNHAFATEPEYFVKPD